MAWRYEDVKIGYVSIRIQCRILLYLYLNQGSKILVLHESWKIMYHSNPGQCIGIGLTVAILKEKLVYENK